MRVGSRWHPDKDGYNQDPRLSKMLLALLCSLKGTPFIYQGEELGLPEATIPFEQIQDPWGKYLYPLWQGRDGCRTPMPWQAGAPQAGFTTGTPWLPIPAAHAELAVTSDGHKLRKLEEDDRLDKQLADLKARRTVIHLEQ